ncbi:MAG: tetratricopeptide repeat protein [Chloroflexia bacterium]
MRDVTGRETPAFSQWLSRHRKRRGLTQQDLAGLVGYSVETIKKIEEGKRRPSRQVAERLAAGLGIPPQELPLFVNFARGELPAELPSAGADADAPWRVPVRRVTNLPAPPTAFIGREQVVAQVTNLLCRPGVRLLTLTGPPGVGKTRVALQVAAQPVPDFPDGIFFVALAPVLEPTLVATTISQALGVWPADRQPVIEALQSYLREKQLLLVLDNFEHLLPAAPLVSALLASAAGLKVLVTSRALLHLYGEYAYTVPPMIVPDRAAPPPLERLPEYEAVRLFVERATAADQGFVVAAADADDLADICTGLDGLPLALELAAAQVRRLSLSAIKAQLTRRLNLLADGPRDLPARQQTLRAAIGWSYDLLTREQQVLFRRLAVFMGGCAPEAVEAVAAGDELPRDVVASALSALVEMNLLLPVPTHDGAPHFDLLETIRQYAAEILAQAADEEEARVHERHADYFLGLAERAEPELRGPDQIRWFQRLEQEHDNIRAALRWLLDQGAVETAGRLGVALLRFWFVYGHAAEGLQWLEETLTTIPSTPPRSLTPAVHAAMLNAAGVLARYGSDYRQASLYYTRSLELWRSLADRRGMARALYNLAAVVRYEGDDRQARLLAEESLTLSRTLPDKEGSAAALNLLGIMARHQGDVQRAATLCQESLALYREIGDTVHIADVLSSLGTIVHSAGDHQQASAYYGESLTIFRAVGNKPGLAVALTNLGLMALHTEDYAAAAAYYRESLALRRELENTAGIAYALNDMGMVEYKQGKPERAGQHYTESLMLFARLHDTRGIAECLERLAGAAVAQRDARGAAHLLGAADALRDANGTAVEPEDRAEYDATVAHIREQVGDEMLRIRQAGRSLPVEQVIKRLVQQYEGEGGVVAHLPS